MKDHNTVKAAHGSSGASELNTRGAGVLTSAKKKKSTVAWRHNKYLLFCAFLLASFVSSASVYLYTYDSSLNPVERVVSSSNVSLYNDPTEYTNQIYSIYFNNFNGYYYGRRGFMGPAWTLTIPTNGTPSIDFPIYVDTRTYASVFQFPRIATLYTTAESLYQAGYRSAGLQVVSENPTTHYVNFNFSLIVSDVLSSTNNTYQSIVLSTLNNIHSSLGGINTGIQNIHVDVGQLQTDYNAVNQLALNPSAFQYSDLPNMNGSSDFAYQASSVLSDPYISPAIKSQFAANLGRVYGDYLSKAAEVYALDQQDPQSPSYGKSFGDFLAEAGGVSKSMQYQYSTPLTNGMQRMTADWKNAVTNDLAQNTASITNRLAQNTVSITNQLAQWKRDLHDDVNGVAGQLSSVIIDGGNESAVRVNANITGGQMTINGGSIEVGDLSIGRITDGMDGIQGAIQQALADWLDEWYDWVYRNPDSWSEFYRRFYAEFGPEVVTNQERQISLLMGVTNALYTAAWTNELVNIISNGVAGLDLSITNEIWNYYFDRFKKANEFKDDGGLPFSLDLVRQQVFGTGFDESRYRQLDWFSRVELLLYQIGFAETNDVPEVADIQTELEDIEDTVSTHAEDFVNTSVKVVSVFNLLRRFADSVKLAFTPANGELSPMTSGIVLLQGGSWLVNEPLVLNVPVPIQNALRLVFQCIWYLGAFVLGWRVFSAAWDRIVSVVRWIWSVFDV